MRHLIQAFLVTMLLPLPAWGQGGGFVAIVEGEPVTRFELERELAQRLNELARQYPAEALEAQKGEIRRAVLDDLVMRRLLLQRCEVEEIRVGTKDIDLFIDQQIDRVRKGGETVRDREEYLRRVSEEMNKTEEEIRSFFRDQIRIARLYHTKVFQDAFVKPNELRSFYEEHREEFSTSPRQVFRMILIWRNNPDLQQIVKTVEAELAAGEEFVDVVQRYSEGLRAKEGGLYALTDLELDSYHPPLPEVVRGLEPGQVSERVVSATAVHVIRLESREAGKVLGFDEAQEKIRERIILERRLLQQQNFEKSLRQKAHIEEFLEEKK